LDLITSRLSYHFFLIGNRDSAIAYSLRPDGRYRPIDAFDSS
jgi:hypothetical protein